MGEPGECNNEPIGRFECEEKGTKNIDMGQISSVLMNRWK